MADNKIRGSHYPKYCAFVPGLTTGIITLRCPKDKRLGQFRETSGKGYMAVAIVFVLFLFGKEMLKSVKSLLWFIEPVYRKIRFLYYGKSPFET